MTDELMSEIKAPKTDGSIIMVVGVGGAGGNAVNHMWNLGIRGVTFMVCNTDQQALDKSPVELKIRLGAEGLGFVGEAEDVAGQEHGIVRVEGSISGLPLREGIGGGKKGVGAGVAVVDEEDVALAVAAEAAEALPEAGGRFREAGEEAEIEAREVDAELEGGGAD